MTLQELLKTLPKNKSVRIGTENGSGFIYQGKAKDINFVDLWKTLSGMYAEKVYEKMIMFVKDHEHFETRIKSIIDDYSAMKWLPDRNVIIHYPGQFEPDQLVIIIEGEEKLFDYDPKIILPFKDFNENGTETILESVYKSVFDELIDAYVMEATTGSYDAKLNARKDIRRLEAWINNNPYGIVRDPKGFIKACKQAAKERVEEKENEESESEGRPKEV